MFIEKTTPLLFHWFHLFLRFRIPRTVHVRVDTRLPRYHVRAFRSMWRFLSHCSTPTTNRLALSCQFDADRSNTKCLVIKWNRKQYFFQPELQCNIITLLLNFWTVYFTPAFNFNKFKHFVEVEKLCQIQANFDQDLLWWTKICSLRYTVEAEFFMTAQRRWIRKGEGVIRAEQSLSTWNRRSFGTSGIRSLCDSLALIERWHERLRA